MIHRHINLVFFFFDAVLSVQLFFMLLTAMVSISMFSNSQTFLESSVSSGVIQGMN